MELTEQEKSAIVNAKIQQWNQQIYSLKLDAKVAKAVEDDKLLQQVESNLKRALIAIETLEHEIDDLTNKNTVV